VSRRVSTHSSRSGTNELVPKAVVRQFLPAGDIGCDCRYSSTLAKGGIMRIDMQPEDNLVFERLKSNGRITGQLRRVITQRWNKCSVCDQHIASGRPAFAGYRADGTPVLVDAECSVCLVELATPIYWTGTLNLSVEDSQPLWRYMDFAKLTAMLQQQGVFFPRADTLQDRFEGAIGLARREEDWNNFYLNYFKQIVNTAPPGYQAPNLSAERIEAEAERLLRDLKASSKKKGEHYVSCWHANSVESEALWRLYCPPPTIGVAIRTSVGSLWGALDKEATAVVGRVHYVDFRRTYADQNHRIFYKRLSLAHEQEVRAVLKTDRSNPVDGRVVRCDLGELIHEVVVSPFAPSWFKDVLLDVIGKFGLSPSIRNSELLDEPFF